MRKFLNSKIGRILSAPFRGLWAVITFPVRVVKSIRDFLNSEPESHSLGEISDSLVESPDARSEVVKNLEALRSHLLRMVLWLTLGVIITAVFTQRLSQILIEPLNANSQLETVELATVEVAESLGVFMRISLLGGVIVALPLLAFELWLFMAPGLYPSAKKKSLLGIPSASALFLGGVVFSYYILVPSALVAMHLINEYFGYKTQWRPESYFSFTTGLLFWMGIGFEFPVAIWILTTMGIVKPSMLKKQWRLAIVIIAAVAAIITPTVDPITMSLVMGPLIILYFLSIGISQLTYKEKSTTADNAIIN